MGQPLIFDTNVLIEFERGSLDREVFDEDDLAVAALTVAELRAGVEIAGTNALRKARDTTITALVRMVTVLHYTDATAAHHARLLAHTRRSGRPRGAHDLILAAHAAETGRTLVTWDAAARFADLPGVLAREP
ncbi:MAG TPA: type II toxin-antitoxin system VapC family toxin [Actinomycetales bacterium]|nr:type II toxin-antitoxin system VapC family toxin [Actinomycetales bacterium]